VCLWLESEAKEFLRGLLAHAGMPVVYYGIRVDMLRCDFVHTATFGRMVARRNEEAISIREDRIK